VNIRQFNGKESLFIRYSDVTALFPDCQDSPGPYDFNILPSGDASYSGKLKGLLSEYNSRADSRIASGTTKEPLEELDFTGSQVFDSRPHASYSLKTTISLPSGLADLNTD
jgi:hypothetical protein